MLYSKETKLVRREVYDFVTALNSNINKTKSKKHGKTMLTGKPKKD
ncbi:hypothetical protein [Tamlana flava]